MEQNQSDKMMKGAPRQKQLFHFSGDGIHWPKAIWAETIQEAEKIWHSIKSPISKPNSAPAPIPPAIPAAPSASKVEDKPIVKENE